MGNHLVYNGIPAETITLKAKQASRARMQGYGQNLFGVRPDWVFAHVARPVLSKGIWRDLAVLHELEPMLAERGESAIYYMLGTLAGPRRPQDIHQMERVYGWPVNHELGYPDLCGGEEVLGDMFANFNRGHEAIRAVFVNQWGWDAAVGGKRMPEGMTFMDIRAGTDLEFGLSVYEPYGISQLEPLCFGALCMVSNVCGCLGFARRTAGDRPMDNNIIEANFTRLGEPRNITSLLAMTIPQREVVEAAEARRLAGLLCERLPRSDQAMAGRIKSGFRLAGQMNWQNVMENYFLPSLESTARTD
jgi:hypothetical protein